MYKLFFTLAFLSSFHIITPSGDRESLPRQLTDPDDLDKCLKCADRSLRNLAILFKDQRKREHEKKSRKQEEPSVTVTTEDGGTVTPFDVNPLTNEQNLNSNPKR